MDVCVAWFCSLEVLVEVLIVRRAGCQVSWVSGQLGFRSAGCQVSWVSGLLGGWPEPEPHQSRRRANLTRRVDLARRVDLTRRGDLTSRANLFLQAPRSSNSVP